MNSHVECYVVRVHPDHNGKNHAPFIRDALRKADIDLISVTPVDPSALTDDLLTPKPKSEVFDDPFKRMLEDVDNTYHPIIHALQEGHGRARISKIRNRGKGVPEEIIAGAMHVLKGHINVSPEDSDELVCPRFLPKEPSEKVVFEA